MNTSLQLSTLSCSTIDDILIKIDEDGAGNPVLGKRAQFKEVIGVGFTYKFIK